LSNSDQLVLPWKIVSYFYVLATKQKSLGLRCVLNEEEEKEEEEEEEEEEEKEEVEEEDQLKGG